VAIIGNVHSLKEHLPHTLNTLNFVALAKSVKTNPQINFEANESNKNAIHDHVARFLQLPKFALEDRSEMIAQKLSKSIEDLKYSNQKVMNLIQSSELSGNFGGEKAPKLDSNLRETLKQAYTEFSEYLNNFSAFGQTQLAEVEKHLASFREKVNEFLDLDVSALIRRVDGLLKQIEQKMISLRSPVKLYSTQTLKMDQLNYETSVGRGSVTSNKQARNPIYRSTGFKRIFNNYRSGTSLTKFEVATPKLEPVKKILLSKPAPNVLNRSKISLFGSFMQQMKGSQTKFYDPESERDISVFLKENFEKDRHLFEEEKRRFEQERQTFLENRNDEVNQLKRKLKKITESLSSMGLLSRQTMESSDEELLTFQLHKISQLNFGKSLDSLAQQKSENFSQNLPAQQSADLAVASQLKAQVESLQKRINNLERQLRNRNKDYLFALKELEKIKSLPLAQPPVQLA